MPYTKTDWEDAPSTATPLSAANLDHLETQYDQAMTDSGTRDIPKSLVDAKGDLLVASADNVLARLPVGTDGQVLTADAASPLGMKYATPAAGGGGGPVRHITPKVGSHVGPPMRSASGSALEGTGTSNSQPGASIILGAQMTVDQIMVNCSGAAAGSGTFAKFLLYASDADGYPSTLILTAGPIDCQTVARKSVTVPPVVLPPGQYWGFVRSNDPQSNRTKFENFEPYPPNLISASDQQGATGRNILNAVVGTYEAPNPTITSWSFGAADNWFLPPWYLIRRSA